MMMAENSALACACAGAAASDWASTLGQAVLLQSNETTGRDAHAQGVNLAPLRSWFDAVDLGAGNINAAGLALFLFDSGFTLSVAAAAQVIESLRTECSCADGGCTSSTTVRQVGVLCDGGDSFTDASLARGSAIASGKAGAVTAANESSASLLKETARVLAANMTRLSTTPSSSLTFHQFVGLTITINAVSASVYSSAYCIINVEVAEAVDSLLALLAVPRPDVTAASHSFDEFVLQLSQAVGGAFAKTISAQPHEATSAQPHDATSAQPHDATSAQPHDATSAQQHDATIDTTSSLPAALTDLAVRIYVVRAYPKHQYSLSTTAANEERYSMNFSDQDYALLGRQKKPRALSQADMVLVKEAWNKMLAWKDSAMEAMMMRWVTLCGGNTLPDLLGPYFRTAFEDFFGMLDLAVRSLQPHTETIAREAYRGVHPSVDRHFNSVHQYLANFADLGLLPTHWEYARQAFIWALSTHVPYFEEPERLDALSAPGASAINRFFVLEILQPAIEEIKSLRALLMSHEVNVDLLSQWRLLQLHKSSGKEVVAFSFFRHLQQSPDLVPFFHSQDNVVAYLTRVLDLVPKMIHSLPFLRKALLNVGEEFRIKHTPSFLHVLVLDSIQRILQGPAAANSSDEHAAQSPMTRLFRLLAKFLGQAAKSEEGILKLAKEYYELYATEKAWSATALQERLTQIQQEVHATGTYNQTSEEIQYGAQVAWRNSAKCIGRINWNSLMVRDFRHVTEPAAMFQECVEHLKIATGGSNIVSVMTVFQPRGPRELWGTRFWAAQFVRYAGYPDASAPNGVLGDPANKELTAALQEQLGWQPLPVEQRTRFDPLPCVIDVPGHTPKVFEWPREYVYEVKIEHPTEPKFVELGMRWCTVPTISSFRLSVGGVDYVACPFNGWFMELEVTRNLMERYGFAPAIARLLGYDTAGPSSIWKTQAYLQTAQAVQYSFQKNKYTIVDQHQASNQFLVHCTRERSAGREVPGQWSWIGGLVGPTCPVWHHEMRDFYLRPQYHYQSEKYLVEHVIRAVTDGDSTAMDVGAGGSPTVGQANAAATAAASAPLVNIVIAFGSETGTAETYARKATQAFQGHQPLLVTIDDFVKIVAEPDQKPFSHVLVLVSTFGEGGAPHGAKLWEKMHPRSFPSTADVGFSVCAFGSSVYPKFCAFGRQMDCDLLAAGAQRLVDIALVDELNGQSVTFEAWLAAVLDAVPLPAGGAGAALDPVYSVRAVAAGAAASPSGLSGDVLVERCVAFRVTDNSPLLPSHADESASRGTHNIALDVLSLKPGPTASVDWLYETGDHLGVRPCNPPALIQRFLAALMNNTDHALTVALTDSVELVELLPGRPPSVTRGPFPNNQQLQTILQYAVCLQLTEASLVSLLKSLARKTSTTVTASAASGGGVGGRKRKSTSDATDFSATQGVSGHAEAGLAQLNEWVNALTSGGHESTALTDELLQIYTDVPALLEHLHAAFGLQFSLEDTLPHLSPQKARYYSISSSNKKHPSQIHLTVGRLHLQNSKGKQVSGLCSNYLCDLKVGDIVQAQVNKSNFRSPADKSSPVVCAAIGTGLAPFIGFLEDREVQTTQRGTLSVFFGCRSRAEAIYRSRLAEYTKPQSSSASKRFREPVLSQLSLALSREAGVPKEYVQQSLLANGAALCAHLMNPKCHYYFCGDGKVADECYDALLQVLQVHGKMSHIAAINHVNVMKMQHRYQLDVWGVMLAQAKTSERIKNLETLASHTLMHGLESGLQLSEDLEQNLLRAFNSADIDGSGDLSVPELRHVLRRLLPRATIDQLDVYIKLFDNDGSGQVTFAEFRSAVTILGLTDDLLRVSQQINTKLSEKNESLLLRHFYGELQSSSCEHGLDRASLARLLSGLKADLPTDELERIVDLADADGSGSVSFSELKQVVGALQLMTDVDTK